jgi:hypothetical protein
MTARGEDWVAGYSQANKPAEYKIHTPRPMRTNGKTKWP